MANEDKDQDPVTSILDMSDEDMANFDPSTIVTDTSDKSDEQNDEDTSKDDEADKSDEDDADTKDDADDESKDDSEDGDKEGEADEDTDKPVDKTTPTADSKKVVDTSAKKDAKVAADPADKAAKVPDVPAEVKIDFEAEYKKLTTPFKANGKEIQITKVEDAIALMQMGANYNKKMAALKPNLRLMKMLESNGLMDETNISYLIDLHKKDPAAINKLVMESKIDPLDLTAKKASEYKPGTYSVDEHELELDAVLGELDGSAGFTRTLEVVSKKWDGASKQQVAQQPQLLKVINDHVERGIYDVIAKEVESERTFGRLNGLSDIEAYRQVGDAIQKRGGFDHLTPQTKTAPAAPVVVTPKPKKVDDESLRDKKRAASSTKAVPAAQQSKDFNVLGMSDADFEKQIQTKFL